MPDITRETIAALIPNTEMQKVFVDGVHKAYAVNPINGYLLHDSAFDEVSLAENGTEKVRFRYKTTETTISASYDFRPFQVQDETGMHYTGYGDRLLYTLPESDVPANSVFGGGTTPPAVTE